jgi:hypothetical protein
MGHLKLTWDRYGSIGSRALGSFGGVVLSRRMGRVEAPHRPAAPAPHRKRAKLELPDGWTRGFWLCFDWLPINAAIIDSIRFGIGRSRRGRPNQ